MRLVSVITKNHQNTVKYNNPTTRQNFNYATPVSSDKNPENFGALDPYNDENYVMTPKPALQATSLLFEPNQVQSALSPGTFSAQQAGIFSNAELTFFWYHEHSDTILKLFLKAISFDFLATAERHPTDFYSPPNRNRFNPYNVLRFSLHDHFFKNALLFALDWFAHALLELIGFACHILTKCGKNFSTFLFKQNVCTFLL